MPNDASACLKVSYRACDVCFYWRIRRLRQFYYLRRRRDGFFYCLLILYLLAKRRLLIGLRSSSASQVLCYCAWCLTTYTWSEVPNLSIAKAAAFSLVAVAFRERRLLWVCERGSLGAISYLAPVTVLAICAGSAGTSYDAGVTVNLDMYQGLTYNPNMLGSLLAMALPLLL